jgi:hypothetical protein
MIGNNVSCPTLNKQQQQQQQQQHNILVHSVYKDVRLKIFCNLDELYQQQPLVHVFAA